MADDTDDADRQARQDRMSKALGAAFLAHKVDMLQQDVDKLSLARGTSGQRRGQRHSARHQAAQPRPRRSEGPPDVPLIKRIVDASALLQALPVLKQWCRAGHCQLIVPKEAVVILDALKADETPMAHAAREATRFLDAQLERPASSHHRQMRVVGQHDGEEVPLSVVESALAPRLRLLAEEHKALVSPYVEEEEALDVRPIDSFVPRHVQSELCLAFHIAKVTSEKPSIVVYRDNLTTDDRVSGRSVNEWARIAGFEVLEITFDDVETVREEIRAFHRDQQDGFRGGGHDVGGFGSYRGRPFHRARGRGRGGSGSDNGFT